MSTQEQVDLSLSAIILQSRVRSHGEAHTVLAQPLRDGHADTRLFHRGQEVLLFNVQAAAKR